MSQRKRLVLSKAKARSAITNGRDILRDLDGRSVTARRYRDIYTGITEDHGGADLMSQVALQLARRYAAASCMLEDIEALLCRGEKIDIETFVQLAGLQSRLAARLGIARIPRNVTPDLQSYLRTRSRQADIVDAEAAE